MVNSILTNQAMEAAKIALDGLSLRRDVIAQNIANSDTPNYLAQEVDFETTLQMALKSSVFDGLPHQVFEGSSLSDTDNVKTLFSISKRSGGTVRADGNNVDTDLEFSDLTATALKYQTISSSVTKKYALLKSISTGG